MKERESVGDSIGARRNKAGDNGGDGERGDEEGRERHGRWNSERRKEKNEGEGVRQLK